MKIVSLMISAGLMAGASIADASPLFSNEWAAEACNAWNRDSTLAYGLAGKWIKNDAGHGHKVIQLYRTECGDASRSEMRIALKDGKAICVYGGAVQTELDPTVDYLMYGKTAHWIEMGAGEYGPMKALMFGKLRFQGPREEIIVSLESFDAFLKLTGQVPGTDTANCPSMSAPMDGRTQQGVVAKVQPSTGAGDDPKVVGGSYKP